MSRALLIARVRVDDPETFARYTARVPAILARHNARFLCRGGAVSTLEGAEEDRRIVVIEFESPESLRAFYDDPEYREILPLRLAATESEVIGVTGV